LILSGQFLAVFAVVALSGPGRIDIVDGQTRYEVARSLVDHGDSVIRDPDVWFGVFPGRDGQRYTTYRLPQSLLGAAAVALADATGDGGEARRHFFFALTGAWACALLAVIYTVWFRWLGQSWRAALVWSCLGIVCTPNWYYGTTTFDDILGAVALVGALALAFAARQRGWGWALAAGLTVGLAFHCKQPLGIFLLPALAAAYNPKVALRRQAVRLGLLVAGFAVGLAVYKAYDWYKFPYGSPEDHPEWMAIYGPRWAASPVPGLAALALSPAAGVLWYCPTLLLSLVGFSLWYRSEKLFCRTLLAASAIFLFFLVLLTFFKGDPCWGPRYLTPLLAVGWVFVPAGASLLRRHLVVAVLAVGLLVQMAGLSVDPHRLYVQRELPSAFYMYDPWIYFHPAAAHLLNRPRELVEVWSANGERAEAFSPVPRGKPPTFTLPVSDEIEQGARGIGKYHLFQSFRPWWHSQQYLPSAEQPVALLPTLGAFAAVGVAGLLLMLLGAGALAARGKKDLKDLKDEKDRDAGLSFAGY
jgi:hypothetical protein